jgi:AraC family transcriptional regulator, transcriptional activator of pobA
LNFEYSKLEKAYNVYDASHAHRHDYFEILIFDKTGGTHEIDFVTYPVKKDTIHFLSPGQVHLLRRDKSVTGHVLAFKEEAFLSTPFANNEKLLMPSSAVSPVITLDKAGRAKINNSLSNLLAEYSNEHSYSAYSLSAHLLLFFIEVMKHLEYKGPASKQSSSNTLYHNFRRLVDNNITSSHSVAQYASQLNVTAGHLNDTVKKESGKNASDIIHSRLLLEAKRLLYHSQLSVKEIAAMLNYDDPAYFTRFFKTHEKITPGEFREQVRKRYS